MSERIPALSSKHLIKALKKLGFIVKAGGKGSHTKLEHPETGKSIVIPKNEHLGVGIRTQIIKDLEAMGHSRQNLY